MRMNRVIITGASGPLGLALIKMCVEKGIFVKAIVRPMSVRKCNIPKDTGVSVVECDLRDIHRLDLTTEDSYDLCFHLGWLYTSREERNDYYGQEENIGVCLKVADLAKRTGCRALIVSGSQAEYGHVGGVVDETTPTVPDSPYGVAKLSSFYFLNDYCEKIGVRMNWIRVFSVYGPYENDYILVSYVIRSLLSKEVPRLTRCEQMWDFLYCEDAARAFLDIGSKVDCSGIFCLGSGEANSLLSFVEEIRNQIDPSLKLGIGEVPYSDNQIMHLQADISKIKKMVGFYPVVGVKEGIHRTIEWYKRCIV